MKCVVKNNSSMDMGPLLPLLKSLLPYSRKKLGFNRPPSLFFASDTENASKPLGKTAFYDPEGVSITIFVDGRHPKDILRSISHELVHHMQHERGDFGTDMATGEGYAQKNDALRELEREAYESGNMCFRDWEDENKHALQEAKQHFDRKNKKMSAKDKRSDKIESLLMEKWGFKAKVSDVGLIQEEKKSKLLEWQLPDMIPGEEGLHSIYPDWAPGGGEGGILGAPIKAPEKEIEEPGPDMEALRATQAYKDTMQGKQGAIDQTALSDMSLAARDERSSMIGRGIDLSPDAGGFVGPPTPGQEEEWKKGAANTVNTVSALLDRGDLDSRKFAIDALMQNDDVRNGLSGVDAGVDINYLARAKGVDGEFIFNTVDDFRILALPNEDPAKQKLNTKIKGALANATKKSEAAASMLMTDIYGLTMGGESRDTQPTRGIFSPSMLGYEEHHPQAIEFRKGFKEIDANMKRGYTCPDGSDVCTKETGRKEYGQDEYSEAVISLNKKVAGSPSAFGTGAGMPHVVGSHEIDQWGIDQGTELRHHRNTRGGIYSPLRGRNPGNMTAGQQKLRDQHQDGDAARTLLVRNWEMNRREALKGLEDGSSEHEQAKNEFEKNNPFEALMQSYNFLLKQQRSEGSAEVIGEKKFALQLGQDIRNGYKLNRFGVIDPDQREKIGTSAGGSSFHELLSTDFGKETLMPPDFSRESQLWYAYARKTFEIEVNSPEDLEAWKAKMRDDRRPRIVGMASRADIGGRWSNTAMQRRNRLHVARAVFTKRSKEDNSQISRFGADRSHREPKDGYGKPAGRREDDITREALIRKVVQEALKRKFGE